MPGHDSRGLYHSGSRPRTSAPGPTARPAVGPAAVLALQRRVGNRAVRQVLQRATTGLKETKATSDFTKEALAYWQDPANKDNHIGEYALVLAKKANVLLKNLNIPEVKPVLDTSAPYHGAFDWTTWKMRMNIASWSKTLGANARKLKQLTMEEAADAAGTIYHEARHAEQRFRMARMMADQSKSKKLDDIADEIAKALQIKDRKVALAAAAAPLANTTANADLLAEARDWEASTVGFHVPYRNVVLDWLDEVRNLRKTITQMESEPMKVTSYRPRIASVIDGWRTSGSRTKFLATHLKATKARKPQLSGDPLVMASIKTIDKAMTAVDKEWKQIERTWDKDGLNTRLQHIIALKPSLSALDDALYDAYKTQAHEKDAFEAGGAVSAQFKAAAAPKPAPAAKPAPVPATVP